MSLEITYRRLHRRKMAASGLVLVAVVIGMTLLLAACGSAGALALPDAASGFGPQPMLPAPQSSVLPTVHIAPAQGWPEGTAPRAAVGTRVERFAAALDHPRWDLRNPNGRAL